LSWLLRHGARDAGIDMDAAGWAPVPQVLAALGISADELQAAVDHNTKQRLQRCGDRIRASQGHSMAGTPVTLEALEASWEPVEPVGMAWHGTQRSALDSIRRDGLLPGDRTHVHLAASPDSERGKRTAVDVLLGVDLARLGAAGLHVYQAPNEVLLVRRVPPELIVETNELDGSRAS
jgi:putative RNA 2'-phosphotransferase